MTRMEMGRVNIGCHDKDGDGRSEYRVSRLRSEHRLP